MHISEGVLSPPVLIAGGAIAAFGTYMGIRRLDEEKLPRVGVMASALFMASLIRFPVGPSSVHLVLNGLAGLLLGWSAFPAFLVSLFLQAVLFQFGGLTTLGVSTVTMAGPAVVVYFLFRRGLTTNRAAIAFGATAAGLGVLLGALAVCGALVASGGGFLMAARGVLLLHVPVIVIESIVGGLCVGYLHKVRPEMLATERRHE